MAIRTIAVFGATGRQGQGVVNALLEHGGYQVRAITRNTASEKAQALAAMPGVEVVAADLDQADTLLPALVGVHGVFLVTNFWEGGTAVDELSQVERAVAAARANGVSHFVWSTLPNVHDISDGRFRVPHFTAKAHANHLVANAGFAHYSFVEAPSFFQNFLDTMGPQPTGQDDQKAFTVPISADLKCVHAGDINDLGRLVLQVFEQPEKAGAGEILSLAAGRFSWQDLADVLNSQGHNVIVNQVPGEMYDTFFEGAAEIREMMDYFAAHTYFGPDAAENTARANALLNGPVTGFAEWAERHMPA